MRHGRFWSTMCVTFCNTLLRRGGRADLMMERYLKKSARPGAKRKRDSAQPQERSNRTLSDLPRRADFKVALNLLDRRCAPSSKEGIG